MMLLMWQAGAPVCYAWRRAETGRTGLATPETTRRRYRSQAG
jgi:hypothetical protein